MSRAYKYNLMKDIPNRSVSARLIRKEKVETVTETNSENQTESE